VNGGVSSNHYSALRDSSTVAGIQFGNTNGHGVSAGSGLPLFEGPNKNTYTFESNNAASLEKTGDELNEKLPPANQPAVTLKKSNALSLRQWIKRAILLIEKTSGTRRSLSSPNYLESAIKIAISLTEQINQAEKLYSQYGIYDTLDALSISAAHDWAGSVIVHMNDVQQKDVSIQDEDDQDLDQQLKSFLEACEAEDSQNAQASQAYHGYNLQLETQGGSTSNINSIVGQQPNDINDLESSRLIRKGSSETKSGFEASRSHSSSSSKSRSEIFGRTT
jgi:hypothetical protein